MARNLRKFVNPKFMRTAPLSLLRRLLELHRDELIGLDLAIFDGDPQDARAIVSEFLLGDEERFPAQLVASLHRIAELGTDQGLGLIIQRARGSGVALSKELANSDPKHVALAVFLDHPDLFDEAAKVIAFFRATGVAEFVGCEAGVEPQFDGASLATFSASAERIFETELLGHYCTVDCYDDDGEATLIIGHGAPMIATPIIEERSERVITFRSLQHSYVAYSALDGRLKMSGTAKSRRDDLAEAFARAFLDRPGFFSGKAARRLYTLASIERDWPSFALRHAFDGLITSARIVEVQADEWTLDLFGRPDRVIGSIVARDAEGCALKRLNALSPDIEFASGPWRIGQIVIRLKVRDETGRTSSVTVRVRPDADASFKRQRFEDQVMRFLRRNGFCHDDADRTAVAAE